MLSLRQGQWKLIRAGKGPAVFTNTNTETGLAEKEQCFDLAKDLGETKNVAVKYPDRVREMHRLLDAIREGPTTLRGRDKPTR